MHTQRLKTDAYCGKIASRRRLNFMEVCLMARDKIVFDKTEVVLTDTYGKRVVTHNLTFEKIVNIRFDNVKVRNVLWMVPTRRIAITVRGRENPIVIYEFKDKEYFERYMDGLRKFAKDNRISFYDELNK